jgi:hypothetical protein
MLKRKKDAGKTKLVLFSEVWIDLNNKLMRPQFCSQDATGFHGFFSVDIPACRQEGVKSVRTIEPTFI